MTQPIEGQVLFLELEKGRDARSVGLAHTPDPTRSGALRDTGQRRAYGDRSLLAWRSSAVARVSGPAARRGGRRNRVDDNGRCRGAGERPRRPVGRDAGPAGLIDADPPARPVADRARRRVLGVGLTGERRVHEPRPDLGSDLTTEAGTGD